MLLSGLLSELSEQEREREREREMVEVCIYVLQDLVMRYLV